jgi:NAD-dependent SIR2 family protein deacetylase
MSTVILTGAGISALSGLPTYRGKGGLYNGKILEYGFTIEQILSTGCQKQYPEITEKYINQIKDAFKDAEPNYLHEIVAEWQGAKVFTQNIDDLHEKAGSIPVHLHGQVDSKDNPLVLFGMDLNETIIDSWLQALRLANTIIVIGTSCQFEYLLNPISEAVCLGGAKLYLLDSDEKHPLSPIATAHLKAEADIHEALLYLKKNNVHSTKLQSSNS